MKLVAVKPILNPGFTLVELVMTIVLLSILAAVAIPNFIDFRTDAKNASTQSALGTVRTALAILTASIALKEDPTLGTPKYPTYAEVSLNTMNGSHPVLTGSYILDKNSGGDFVGITGIPNNPWSVSTGSAYQAAVINCAGNQPSLNAGAPYVDVGWCYRQTNGKFWANSDLNGGAANLTENYY